MKKIRKIIFLAVVLLMGAFIVSCNGDDNDYQAELDSVKELLSIGFTNSGDKLSSVTGDLTLVESFESATITWTSDNEDVISVDGKVVRQDDDVRVVLTATIKIKDLVETKRFNITVTKTHYDYFTVSFDSGVASQSVRDGLTATKPEDPTMHRHSFEGWFLEDAKEPFDFDTPITENLNLVAKWEFSNPMVTYKPGYPGGILDEEEETLDSVGATATKPEDPTRYRYSFEGWFLEDAEEPFDFDTPVTEDIELTAQWKYSMPGVKFLLGYTGAPQIEEQILNSLGEKASKPTDPTRDRFTFAGWYLGDVKFDFDTPVTEDITLMAKWSQDEVVVSFEIGYAEGVNPSNQSMYVGEKAFQPMVDDRERYEFVGWFVEDSATEFDFDSEILEDVHLIAKWNQLIAIVSFDVDGGSPRPANTTIQTGQKLTEPTEPTKDGYDFLGWFSGSEKYNFANPVTQDLNLVAQWIDAEIQISATITGPSLIAHYVGTVFDPLYGFTAVDNETGEEYELFIVGFNAAMANFPNTYNYKVAVLADPSIEKNVKLTVKPAVVIPNAITTPVTITLWHSNGKSIEDKLKEYAGNFKTLMSSQGMDITVNIVKNGSTYDELRSNVINAIKGAELPHIVQNYPDHVVEYNNNGVIESLTPYIFHPIHGLDQNNPNERLEDIITAYLEENRSNNLIGDYLSFPFSKSTEVAAYNKTFFDAVLKGRPMPETWQDLFALVDDILAIKDAQIDQIATRWAASGAPLKAEQITKAKNEFVPYTYDSVGNGFITLTKQFGGEYTGRDPQTGKGQVKFINDNTIRMLNYFSEDRGRTFTVPQFWGVEYGNAVSFQGTTIFSVGSTGGLRYNLPVNKGYKLYDIGVMPVPYDKFNPSSRTVIQQGTNLSITNKGTAQEKLAAWLFIKYLTSTDVQADYGSTIGYSPVRLSSYETEVFKAYLAKADRVIGSDYQAMGLSQADYNTFFEETLIAMGARAAAQQTQYMFYDEAFIGSSKAREAVGEAFERVMLAKASENMATVINSALQAAKEETERVIP